MGGAWARWHERSIWVNLARDLLCGFLFMYVFEYIFIICVSKILMDHLRASGSGVTFNIGSARLSAAQRKLFSLSNLARRGGPTRVCVFWPTA